MKKLSVEVGVDSVYRSDSNTGVCKEFFETINTVQENAVRLGIELSVMPYNGVKSFLSTGTRCSSLPSVEKEVITKINAEGYPFALALNGGGIYRQEEIDLQNPMFGEEKALLDHLAETGDKYRRKNAVVITNDGLLHEVRIRYPGLTTIASCIRFSGDRKGISEKYNESFKDFDMLVPANADTRYGYKGFITKHCGNIHQIVPFLNLSCSTLGAVCQMHYLSGDLEVIRDIQKNDPGYISTMTHRYIKALEVLNNSPCKTGLDAMLITDTDALRWQIQEGIKAFKIARSPHNSGRFIPVMEKLLPLFSEQAA